MKAMLGAWIVLGLPAQAALAAPSTSALDVVIEGCNEGAAGEIGIRELLGSVGDTVGVAVTIHTVNEIDAFSLDIAIPPGLLRFDRAEPGPLTSHFSGFGGMYLPAQGQVRLSGFGVAPIPSGATGRIGIVWFEVLAPGSGAFSTGDYLDDVAGYTPCEQLHGTSPVRSRDFGRVKAAYR
jgi:hypothetical protein